MNTYPQTEQEMKEWWLFSRGDRNMMDVRADEEGREYVVMYNGLKQEAYKVFIPSIPELELLHKQIEI